MKRKQEKILVSGGAGFIGSHLVEQLVAQGAEVIVIDNLTSGREKNLNSVREKIRFYRCDIRHYQKLKEILRAEKPSLIFHLAAHASVPDSARLPRYDFSTNALGSFNLLSLSRFLPLKKFIYASSVASYGEPQTVPIKETHPLEPISIYGATKLSAERLGLSFYHTYGLPFVALRLFNIYGPRQPRYVMRDFFCKIRQNPDQLTVLGEGEQIRDFCYVADCVRAFLAAAEKKESLGEVFNIGSGQGTKIKDLARLIIEIEGKEGKTELCFTGSSWPGDAQRLVADINKARRLLGFQPRVSLRQGLISLRQWLVEEKII